MTRLRLSEKQILVHGVGGTLREGLAPGCMPCYSFQVRGEARSGTLVRKHCTALNNVHYDSSPIELITWTGSIAMRKVDPKSQNRKDGY